MRRLDGHSSAWEFPKVQHSSHPGGKIRDSISDIGPGGVASALSKIQRAITKPLNPGRLVASLVFGGISKFFDQESSNHQFSTHFRFGHLLIEINVNF